MNQRVIYCNHNTNYCLYSKSRVCKGSTWIFKSVPGEPEMICVQYSVCSEKDNFCKATGKELARISREIIMLKTELPKFVEATSREYKVKTLVPNLYEVFQVSYRV